MGAQTILMIYTHVGAKRNLNPRARRLTNKNRYSTITS